MSLLQATATAALLIAGPVWMLLALTAAIGCGVAVSAPAEFSLLPIAAGEAGIAKANGYVESARYLGMTAGPVLGGCSPAVTSSVAVLVNLASFLAVALAGALLCVRRLPATTRAAGDSGRAREGLKALVADPGLRTVVVSAVAALAFFSISMTAELFFLADTLGGGQAGYGIAIGVWTGGMVVGAVALSRRVPTAALALAATAAIAAQGAGLLGAALSSTLAVAFVGIGFGGVAHGLKNVVIRTLIHARVPDALRGRAYAGYNAVRNAAELGAIAVGGVLVGLIGARAALAISGAVPLAIGVVAVLFLQGRPAGAAAITTRRSVHAHHEG